MGNVLECARCGATLRAEAAQGGFVTCEYCGAQTSIYQGQPAPATAPGSDQATHFVPAPGSSTNPDWSINDDAVGPGGGSEASASSTRKAGGALKALVGLGSSLLTLAIIAGAIYYSMRGFSTTYNPDTKSRVEPRALWVRGQPVCLVQANNDSVADIAVLMKVIQGDGQKFHQVQIRDGRTGKQIGNSDPLGYLDKVKVVCLGPGHLGLVGQDLKLHLFSVHPPIQGPVVTLRDKIKRVAATSTCARIATADGSIVEISLPAGKPLQCKAGPLHRLRRHPGMPTFRKQRTFNDDKVQFRIAARRRGSPVLTVSAHQGAKLLWKRELDITATRFGIPAILTKRTLLVVGALHPRRKRARLIGLDLASGERRFTVRLQGGSIATFGCAIVDNGVVALLWSSAGVVAFDPTSGREVWRLQ